MLLAVTNRALCKEPFLERIKKIAKEEIADYLILREKDLSHQQYISLAKDCKEILSSSVVRFIVHSDIEAALELSVDAIHLPFPIFKDTFLTMAEERKRRFSFVGVSIHSIEEAIFVEKNGGDYITAGHIFATDCKKGIPGRGLGFLKQICDHVSIPVYAIGGIQKENLSKVLDVGAAGGAIMSGFMRD